MIEKEFAPYEPSLALKELGFDEPCFGYFEPNKKFEYLNWETFKDFPYLAKNSEWQDLYGAPTFSQAFRFFREKYKIRFIIQSSMSDLGEYFKVIFPNGEQRNVSYNTYEEAELACLIKLIEIVKNQ